MAKSKLNPALDQLRGKIGDLVFRQVRGKLVVSRAPDFSRRKLSAAQKASCRRFREGVRYAKMVLADPEKKAAFKAKAAAQGLPLIATVVSEYFQSARARR